MATRKKNGTKDGVNVRGFYRVNLVEHDDHGVPRIVGDSGWVQNMVVATGKLQYLAMALGAQAGSKQISRMALGTGTEPASNATSIDGELADATGASSTRNRAAVAVQTGLTGSPASIATVQFAATWASTGAFATTTHNIRNIAVIENLNNAGTIFAGNTFSSSLLNTNQDVQASYVISFS